MRTSGAWCKVLGILGFNLSNKQLMCWVGNVLRISTESLPRCTLLFGAGNGCKMGRVDKSVGMKTLTGGSCRCSWMIGLGSTKTLYAEVGDSG